MIQSQARRALGALVISVALTACGSTVQVRSTGALPADGLSSPVATDGATTGTSDGLVAGGSTSGSTGSLTLGTTGVTTTQTGSTGGATTPAQVVTTPGSTGSTTGAVVNRKPLKIGVITQQGLEKAAKGLGFDGVTTGDTREQVDAVLAWVKAHGGLAGRSVEVVQYDANLAAGSSDQIMTEACTAFTQDTKVDFVVTLLTNITVLAACLAKAGVGLLADNSNFGDSTLAKYAPILGDPSELAPGRMMNLLVDQLSK